MTARLRVWAATAATMLALDLLWLGVIAPPLYHRAIGPLLRPAPDAVAAALFYAVYLAGVNTFVVNALAPEAPAARVMARGAGFGFVAYGTFDLTAQAVLAGWSPLVTAADMAWGTLLTAVVALAGHAARRLAR